MQQVDVFELPNYELNRSQQEWLWLFSLIVAGKSAEFATKKLDALLEAADPCDEASSPFEALLDHMSTVDGLDKLLRRVKTGQYRKLVGAFKYSFASVRPDDPKLTIKELERCPGCGPKTARFFFMMTRKDARCAALDTHLLKFMRDMGHEAPKQTPPAGRTYDRLERAFLAECDKRRVSPAAFDMELWKLYRKGGQADATARL
jgi:hypothetical protein